MLGATALAMSTGVLAAPRDYLFRNARICDAAMEFCMRGTLSYDSNPRLLHLRARVQTAPGPGLLQIWLTGANRQGHRRFAPFELRVRGQATEILDHKMVPDYPDAHSWAVDRVRFIADSSL